MYKTAVGSGVGDNRNREGAPIPTAAVAVHGVYYLLGTGCHAAVQVSPGSTTQLTREGTYLVEAGFIHSGLLRLHDGGAQ